MDERDPAHAPVGAYVDWPSAPLTHRLVHDSLSHLNLAFTFLPTVPANLSSSTPTRLLQWASYDGLNHDLTLTEPSRVLASSYTIRKCLIRKHYLSHCISAYLTKHPDSILRSGTPKTWEVEISWSDEIDEKWTDELWDLGVKLDENQEKSPGENKWFILKPGMADRGNGIRLFDSKEALQCIFEEWDDSDDEDPEAVRDPDLQDDEEDSDRGVVTSQLRHFIIQEYLAHPLLLDPSEVPLASSEPAPKHNLKGHKFHIRAYVLARGALQVYLYTNALALFSSAPYGPPSPARDSTGIDLTPHLTNTCLQPEHSEAHVRTLDELVGCSVLSADGGKVVTQEDVERIKIRMGEITAEVFKAALENPIHFQPLPNAFELFGVDFLVSHPTSSDATPSSCPYTVTLLELNAEPAIEMTGPRLHWLLEGLFRGIGRVAVGSWVERRDVGEDVRDMRKVLDVEVRGRGGW
ncbi:TTL-domain-containing protein [Gloeophyllum trabeum ATCC 11539]|uniref:TTL-domain-containing protein n=1 Tax=Gloeophyllum trabeum (strain ATCC 11539 / FP-39264 / Madison 617) TaxID=670483 RepID=S7S0G3_GLOTA|nr:TTL-domain-containing protein [Gloeophyllum trabeum ATCC 11539]EPQ60840.1 TTL-domain-containing protein [Gloeophyllum trabeum ATCC 11539]